MAGTACSFAVPKGYSVLVFSGVREKKRKVVGYFLIALALS